MYSIDGQCYHFKILVPAVAAGAIIGKGGETIAHLQKEAGARIKMSKANDFYPGKCGQIWPACNALLAKSHLEFLSSRQRTLTSLAYVIRECYVTRGVCRLILFISSFRLAAPHLPRLG